MARDEGWSVAVAEAYRTGETIEGIGRRLGPSRSSIQREIARQGLARRTGPVLRDQTITIPSEVGKVAYFAGLFDGEGNLYWRRRTGCANSARLAIYNTHAGVMEWLQETFGGFVRWDHARVEKHGWKPIAVWEVTRQRDAIALLTAAIPFLVIKRAKAEEVLADLRRNLQPAA